MPYPIAAVRGKGSIKEEATTNLYTHPSSETSVIFDLGVVAGAGSVASSTDFAFVGAKSDKMISTNLAIIRGTVALGATNTLLTFSVWVYNPDKIASRFQVFAANPYAAGVGTTILSLTNIGNSGWERAVISNVYSSTAIPWIDIRFLANGTLYVDALQVEEKAYATSYCDGSLGPGYSWTGVAHASTSERA